MMKKRNILILLLSWVCLCVSAVPAKQGRWRTVQLQDGKMVRVQLCGDERLHFFADAEGNRYLPVKDAGDNGKAVFLKVSEQQLRKRFKAKNVRASKRPMKMGVINPDVLKGERKGLLILVEFPDRKFAKENTADYYRRIHNEENFSDDRGFRASVKDYFLAQSDGQFILDFDVVGPVCMPKNYAYYGANNSNGDDMHVGEMVAKACEMVDDEVDFNDYDWSSSGMANQVFIIFAGEGEHESMDENTIWPHSWNLYENDYGKTLTLDGVVIDSYGCSNEVDSEGHIAGIGTMCHEFSHCLGLPDTYDILYSGNYGMGNWDVMSGGNYAGGGFKPLGYNTLEKMLCGWYQPTELLGDTTVTAMAPMSEGGESFIIYNKGHKDEFYIIENRALSGWDEYLPGKGVLITYVDYNKPLWDMNIVNATGDFTQYGLPGYSNDHQMATIVHADNDDDYDYYSAMLGGYWKTTEETDPYPCFYNDSLTNTSKPAATLYYGNLNHRKFLDVAIRHIKVDDNGYASFDFEDFSTILDPNKNIEGVLLNESFDMCLGEGGNDGIWSGGTAGVDPFMPDYGDWTYVAASGANKCAKFGTNTKSGAATTPAFTINGNAHLSFKAAPFATDGTALVVSASGNAKLSTTSFTLVKGQWTDCEADITGEGEITITITPTKRMFLDEVKVVDPNIVSQVDQMIVVAPHAAACRGIYTLQGVKIADETTPDVVSRLPKGIYIVDGKKVAL
ncbi:MAG: M6 family metalloprotease domain-containing protein [Bacteroidales bacterium]|nr:M6 family metalloprotease domain-containing protein [Bacteroidales bacterium]